jgi:(hydroxyamino)benzene mutase
MSSRIADERLGHRLLQLGMLLFLIGLLTGFAIPMLANPRMGLTSHLEGIMNGIFLVLLGLVWPKLALSARALGALFWLAVYGSFANWTATLLAAIWGAGSPMMPIAGGDGTGTTFQEGVIVLLLLTLSVAIVAASVLVLWGLRAVPANGGASAGPTGGTPGREPREAALHTTQRDAALTGS